MTGEPNETGRPESEHASEAERETGSGSEGGGGSEGGIGSEGGSGSEGGGGSEGGSGSGSGSGSESGSKGGSGSKGERGSGSEGEGGGGSEGESEEQRGRKWGSRLLLVTLLLHVSLVLYFAPPRLMFSTEPVLTIDYALHYYQVDRARRAFALSGKLWSYDPLLLAGQPAGAIEDLSSKSVELFVIALSSLGVHPALAFNLYIFLVHLLVPLAALAAAFLLGMRLIEAAVATLLFVLLWFFDSFSHWAWFCGMISWSLATLLAVPFVALVYRAAAASPPRLLPWIATALLAALLVLVHPYSVLIVAVPCAAIVLLRFRKLGLQGLVGVSLTIVLAVASSAVWLPAALRLWHYVLDSACFLVPDPRYIFFDFFDLLKEPWHQGSGAVKTLLRTLCLACAILALVRWRRERDPRFLPFALLIGLMIALAYGGGLLWVTRQVQPYRHIMPATYAAALLAAPVLVSLLGRSSLRAMPRSAKTLLVLALVLLLPRFAHNVLNYFPDVLPVAKIPVPLRNPQDPPPEAMSGLYAIPALQMRHTGPDPLSQVPVRDWLLAHHRGRGRILVQDWMLGEYLAATTRLPIIGGLEERNVHHVDAHLFRWKPAGGLPGAALREYLERYAIGLIVVRTFKPLLEWRKDLLTFKGFVGGCRIYETKIKPNYFAAGSGRVVFQDLNRIRIEGAAGREVVLRFHYLETLRCQPGCRVERVAIPKDRVGFIRVRQPPPAFEITNGYF